MTWEPRLSYHSLARFTRLRGSSSALCITALLLLAGCSSSALGATPSSTPLPTATPLPIATSVPIPTQTPSGLRYQPYAPLLAKVSTTGPLYVTGDENVPTQALDAAGAMLQVMLSHRHDIVVTLQAHGTITAVFARTEAACDLPYLAQYKSTTLCPLWVGGAGGTLATPVTTCSEKNLLDEPDDPYGRGTRPYSENVCVHELGHTIMDVGLSQLIYARIQARYAAAKRAGLWGGDYAMTNAQEFFAVMTECYFWAASEVATPSHPSGISGPDALRQYDPATYALIDSIYQGSSDLR